MISVSMTVTQEGKDGTKPYDFLNDLNGTKTVEEFLQFMKDTLVIIADQELREAQAQGFDKTPVIAVDNVIGKSVKDVKPFGSIIFSARQEANVVLAPIYEALLLRSRKDTGLYRDSHLVLYNSKVVAVNLAEFTGWLSKKVPLKNGDIIRFVDIMPYAGKLERNAITATNSGKGRKGPKMKKSTDKKRGYRSGTTVRTPNGTYFLAAKSIVRQFKFNSNIRFEWVNGVNIREATDRAPSTNRRGGKLRKTFKEKKNGRGRKGSYAYPSIVVRINERGLIQT